MKNPPLRGGRAPRSLRSASRFFILLYPSLSFRSDGEICQFCSDPNRDPKVVCVVEEPHNIVGIETTRGFSGRYHVLHGSLSPLRGIGPESLKSKGLLERIGQGEIEEVILAKDEEGY